MKIGTERRTIVITEHDSDLLNLMRVVDPRLRIVTPAEALTVDFAGTDALVLLGGAGAKPMLLAPPLRQRVETACRAGTRVLAEYVASIGHVYFEPPVTTRFARLAVVEGGWLPGEPVGALLDDQCGERLRPHGFTCSQAPPLAAYVVANAHDCVAAGGLDARETHRERALWFEDEQRLLVAAFRLANFARARFAPRARVGKLVGFLLGWIYDVSLDETDWRELETLIPRTYSTGATCSIDSTGGGSEAGALEREALRSAADRALGWMDRAEILVDEGRGGAREGLATEVEYTGRQRRSDILRVDCIGEIAFPYWLHGRLSGDARSDRVSRQLTDYVLDHYLVREPGPLHGMVRWTNEAWGVCYQDDVARALLPHLFRCLYEGSRERLDDCTAALDFLVRTTGTDGTRPFRTDNNKLTPDELERLRSTPGDLPSAHYNGYYYAALCIAYRLTGREAYRATAARGLATIMRVYPQTKREQSQTQELCRLLLPLSWLYEITGADEARGWLYRVARDLQAYAHPSGAYLEWDEGYTAAMRHKAGEGESSLLSRNGDPVADLLYSNNWLPVGWMQAYFATGDRWFKERWQASARFLLAAQLTSANPQLDGGWARAFDVERGEVFGTPADAGWGPWAIESGWTVAEIAAGLYMGLLEEDLLAQHTASRGK